jgi:hypothetical protein
LIKPAVFVPFDECQPILFCWAHILLNGEDLLQGGLDLVPFLIPPCNQVYVLCW